MNKIQRGKDKTKTAGNGEDKQQYAQCPKVMVVSSSNVLSCFSCDRSKVQLSVIMVDGEILL